MPLTPVLQVHQQMPKGNTTSETTFFRLMSFLKKKLDFYERKQTCIMQADFGILREK
jgi:hypothetical protein